MAYIPTKVRRAARTIGEQLRIQRKLMGLTAQMVAERADITTMTLQRIEQGESVRTDVLFVCCGCSACWMRSSPPPTRTSRTSVACVPAKNSPSRCASPKAKWAGNYE